MNHDFIFSPAAPRMLPTRLDYEAYVETKIKLAKRNGFIISESDMHPSSAAYPHQFICTRWALNKGRALIAMSYGLHKTSVQCQMMRCIHRHTGRKTLQVVPLGAKHQFVNEDGPRLDMQIQYVTSDAEALAADTPYLITNYERIRDGGISKAFIRQHIAGASLDEGDTLRTLGSKTYDVFNDIFADVPYRFVATATPDPNRTIEILNYAVWLGIAEREACLNRYFGRNPDKAGDLQLYPHREEEFWLWVSSWALFINKPSDLGFSDEGFDLPPMEVHWHRIATDHTRAWGVTDDTGAYIKAPMTDGRGQVALFVDSAAGLSAAAQEKRASLDSRVVKAAELVNAEALDKHWLLWHHLEDERRAICDVLPDAVAVYGSQTLEQKERLIMDFAHGQYRILATKPDIAGAGCNFQHYCSDAIFVGVDYKAKDVFQAIHRIRRFQQKNQVNIHFIYTDAEDQIVGTLKRKWAQHDRQVKKMTDIIKKYGLVDEAMKDELRRSLGVERQVKRGKFFTAVNNDCVLELIDHIPDNYFHMICTSIPFSKHYGYVNAYEDFGHNETDDRFFEQMNYMTPNLLRTLKPGRVAAIHVKDLISYGSVNGTGVAEIIPFSDMTVAHFRKHGFSFSGRVTIVTDVVRENNSTYRLGWTEQCKDGSKMGVGLPEYWLFFRKLPTDHSNAYADEPVAKSKQDYSCARWQNDASSFWRSNGNRPLTVDEMLRLPQDRLHRYFSDYNLHNVYDYKEHTAIGEALEAKGALSHEFMLLAPQSWSDSVWTDVNFMHSLNAEQVRKNAQKHVCLAKDSSVLTDRGYVAIQDVEIGDLVLTHMGRWRPVIAKQNTGVRPVVKVCAQGVPGLTLTPDHKLWARKSTWVRERDGAERVEPCWIPAQDMLSGYVNLKLPPEEKSALTPRELWLLGRWLADGHVGTRGDFYVSIGREKLSEFEQMAGEWAGCSRELSCTQIRLKNLSDNLQEALVACGKGAANKQLPSCTLTLPSEDARCLLGGYLSGDGHYLKAKNRWTASSVSRELLLGLALLVQRAYGTIASVYVGRPAGKTIIEGREVNTKQDWIFCFDLPSERRTKPFILEDGAWKKVKSIESVGEVETWNLRVAEDESYTAEGCVVKNCPLPFDIVERVIERFSAPGELVYDPFSGLFTVPTVAIQMGRNAYGTELNPLYFEAGVKYCEQAELKRSMPTLFDFMATEQAGELVAA